MHTKGRNPIAIAIGNGKQYQSKTLTLLLAFFCIVELQIFKMTLPDLSLRLIKVSVGAVGVVSTIAISISYPPSMDYLFPGKVKFYFVS